MDILYHVFSCILLLNNHLARNWPKNKNTALSSGNKITTLTPKGRRKQLSFTLDPFRNSSDAILPIKLSGDRVGERTRKINEYSPAFSSDDATNYDYWLRAVAVLSLSVKATTQGETCSISIGKLWSNNSPGILSVIVVRKPRERGERFTSLVGKKRNVLPYLSSRRTPPTSPVVFHFYPPLYGITSSRGTV